MKVPALMSRAFRMVHSLQTEWLADASAAFVAQNKLLDARGHLAQLEIAAREPCGCVDRPAT